MKKLFYLIALSLCISSCSKDDDPVVNPQPDPLPAEETPFINVPSSEKNYFDSSMGFSSQGGQQSLTFSTNKDWTITLSETRNGTSWCKVSPSSGNAGTVTVAVEVVENDSYDNRCIFLKVKAGTIEKSIKIDQKQKDALTLTSDYFEIPVSGGEFEVEVASNLDYQVTIASDCSDWIRQNTMTRGLESSTLVFEVDKSEEYSKREGLITISSGELSETIKVFQAGEGILSLSSNDIEVDSNPHEVILYVNSNFDYAVDFPSNSWIHDIQTRGASSHTVILKVDENESYDSRSAEIRFFDINSDLSETVKITQNAKATILLDQKEFSFDENGGTFSVKVASNIDYIVSIDTNWIAIEEQNQTRGLTDSSLSFIVSSMENTQDRTASIVIKNEESGVSETITVTQTNYLYFEKPQIAILTGESQQLSVVSKVEGALTWTSSDPSIVSVSSNGTIQAKKKGEATITINSSDEKHVARCNIIVQDITDLVYGYCTGGSMVIINGRLNYGSVLNWTFKNGSNYPVTLLSMQLVDGQTNNAGNEMNADAVVAANSSVSYSVRVGLGGIGLPVTCRFKFSYNGNTYTTSATYQGSSW